MSLTNTQAMQIGVLLEWILNHREDAEAPVSGNDARFAAVALADAASKQMGAGISGAKVLALWARQTADIVRSRRRSTGQSRKKRNTP